MPLSRSGPLPGEGHNPSARGARAEAKGKEQTDELAVGKEIAPPQPSRFLDKTVEPLQTKPLQHGWRLLQQAGMVVESGA